MMLSIFIRELCLFKSDKFKKLSIIVEFFCIALFEIFNISFKYFWFLFIFSKYGTKFMNSFLLRLSFNKLNISKYILEYL